MRPGDGPVGHGKPRNKVPGTKERAAPTVLDDDQIAEANPCWT